MRINSSKVVRLLGRVAFIIVFCALVFSLGFIAIESDHECSGEGCEICHEILLCVRVLKLFALVIVMSFAAQYAYSGRAGFRAFVRGDELRQTLVSLKVELLR